jgi:large subunit ribosomal protein L19
VVRRGVVRRAKLYYLRGLTGKRARITERARDSVRPGAKRAGASARPQTEPASEMAGAVEETTQSE